MVSDNDALYPWVAGDLKISARLTAERGWSICDGALLEIRNHTNLHNAIGDRYNEAGDPAGMFRKPNLQRRVPIGAGGVGSTELGNVIGNIGGEEEHTLIIEEMPAHTHTEHEHTGSGIALIQTVTGNDAPADTQSGSAGGGMPHNNLQPSIVLNYFIKL